MLATHRKLEKEISNMSAYGCAAHVLNLLIYDMFKKPEFEKND